MVPQGGLGAPSKIRPPEPVSRIRRTALQTDKLFEISRCEVSMMSTSAVMAGFASHRRHNFSCAKFPTSLASKDRAPRRPILQGRVNCYFGAELSWSALRAINPKPLEAADFCKACNSIWACGPCFVLVASSAKASSAANSRPTNP